MSNRGCVDYTAIGTRLNQRRRALCMTQGELAERAGISTSFIGHLERAEKIPSLETIVRLCSVLDMTLDELILGKKPICAGGACELYDQMSTLLESYGITAKHNPPAR